jgi:hypothetical protein
MSLKLEEKLQNLQAEYKKQSENLQKTNDSANQIKSMLLELKGAISIIMGLMQEQKSLQEESGNNKEEILE